MRAPSLMSLLSAMDGIERKSHIVTIATTNSLAILDKALAQRPGRFDRIVRLGRPDMAQRMELVRMVCGRIPPREGGLLEAGHRRRFSLRNSPYRGTPICSAANDRDG
jgi:SpoVK/Ycf46/Vps4 family AAA+-type ATPase